MKLWKFVFFVYCVSYDMALFAVDVLYHREHRRLTGWLIKMQLPPVG